MAVEITREKVTKIVVTCQSVDGDKLVVDSFTDNDCFCEVKMQSSGICGIVMSRKDAEVFASALLSWAKENPKSY